VTVKTQKGAPDEGSRLEIHADSIFIRTLLQIQFQIRECTQIKQVINNNNIIIFLSCLIQSNCDHEIAPAAKRQLPDIL